MKLLTYLLHQSTGKQDLERLLKKRRILCQCDLIWHTFWVLLVHDFLVAKGDMLIIHITQTRQSEYTYCNLLYQEASCIIHLATLLHCRTNVQNKCIQSNSVSPIERSCVLHLSHSVSSTVTQSVAIWRFSSVIYALLNM